MDKKKIISSLTLAGMLATTVAGSGVFAAETSDPATKALGEYSKLITGKVAVPFILQSKTDRVTGKDMKISFPGKTVTVDDDAVLKTGDVVNVNGEPRTIVIYGDVNCDGEINIRDAVAILSHVNKKKTLDSVAFAAADLDNDGVLSVREAVGVLSRINSKKPYESIATAPKAEVSKVTNKEITANNKITLKFDLDASKYTYAIRDNKAETDVTISNVAYNANKKEATLTTATLERADKDTTFTLTIKDVDGNIVSEDTFKYVALAAIDVTDINTEDGKTRVEGDVAVINSNNQNSLSYRVATTEANSVPTTVVVTLKDKAGKEVTGTATLPANAVAVSVNNFSGVANLTDGNNLTVTIKITDEYGNTKSAESSTLVKDTKALSIANIETTRANQTVKATVTMKDGANADQYFIVKKASESAPTASEVVAGNKKVPAADTALPDVTLTEDVEYTIYVVAVNNNGTISEMASASIAKATAQKLTKVTNVEATATVAGEFSWKDESNTDSSKIKGYKVILYTNDGKAIAVKETSEKKINFLKEIKEYAQENKTVTTYKVGVIAVGANSDVANSDESAPSTTYRTEALATPKAELIISDDTNHQILTWGLNTEAAFYNVNIYKYDENGALAEDAIKTVAVPSTKSECDLTEAMKDLGEGKYYITVNSLASTESTKVDSAESDKYYEITTPENNSDDKDDEIITYNVKAPSDLTLSLKDNKTVKASFSEISAILASDEDDVTYKVYYGIKDANGKLVYTTHSDDIISFIDATKNVDSLYSAEISKYGDSDSNGILDGDLTENTTYGIYVSVLFGNKEIARTDVKYITTAKAPLKVDGLKVVDVWNGIDVLNDDEISYNGDKLVVGDSGNKVYESNDDTANYSAILGVVKALSVGDTITQSETTGQISVTKENTVTANYGDALKDVDLTLNADSTISGTIKSITMGTATKADLSYATVSEKVVVKAGNKVDVKADKDKVTVVEKAATSATGDVDVTINGIKITVKDNTKLKVIATATGLEIAGSDNVVKVSADKDATVKFTGYQSESVELTATKANKTLTVVAENPLGGLVVNAGLGAVDISGITSNSIEVRADSIVRISGDSKQVTFDSKILTIKPTSVVTIKYDGTKVTLNGNASVEFAANATDTEKAVSVKNDAAGATVDGTKLTHVQGEVNYSVKDNVATVTTTTDLTIE